MLLQFLEPPACSRSITVEKFADHVKSGYKAVIKLLLHCSGY